MSVVLRIAVGIYGLFLLFYVVWGAFLIYHLLRFSPRRQTAWVSSAVFIGVSAFILLLSLIAFSRVDWSMPVALPSVRF